LSAIAAPAPISRDHRVDGFNSGESSLDDWLKKRALKNDLAGASRCFVIARDGEVIGYYSLSTAAIAHEAAPKSMRRNIPDPLPLLLLGRLAIDRRFHNQGLGRALLRDAMIRAVGISRDAGVFAILVHAMSEPGKRFCLSRGFVESPLQPMTLMMTLATARAILEEAE
jgi:GNAT superfamily N-acetyltransferase